MRKSTAILFLAAWLTLSFYGAGEPPHASAAPLNDNFGSAILLSSVVTDPAAAVVDTSGATFQGLDGELSPCGSIGSTVWYSWAAPGGSGAVTFDTFGSNFDTVLAVYSGGGLGSLVNEGCNDDFLTGLGRQSRVSFAYTGTTTYYIQLGGFNSATGTAVLNFASGASIVVNTGLDGDNRDSVLTLHEAVKLATGTLACGTLLGGESAQVLNCTAGGSSAPDLIHFDPGLPVTVQLSAGLPALSTGSDVISGIGASVIIDGQTSTFPCLSLTSNDNFISGLDIRRCSIGIDINGGFSNLIGIDISTPAPLASERNILRENGTGLRIINTGGSNVVYGNYIGTDAAGALAIGNGDGLVVENALYGQIGFVGEGRNVISGNANEGIELGQGSFGASIVGNYIGTNPAGTAGLANSGNGVLIQDGNGHFLGNNVISGNAFSGVHIVPAVVGNGNASGNALQRNLIGTDAAGSNAIANGAGVSIFHGPGNLIGGTGASEGNVISGNAEGVVITGVTASRNQIAGNLIGTHASGTTQVPNGARGVRIGGGATSNLVGGTTPNSRNVISGNGGEGVQLDGNAPGTALYRSEDVPKAIPDLTTITSVVNVPETAYINDVNVTLDITHTWDADLVMLLTSPDNTTVELSSNNGQGEDNYTNTTFDDEAATPITAGSPPFTGIFRPEGFLSSFDSKFSAGTWTLTVADQASLDVGTLNSWSLAFTTTGNEVSGNYIGTNAAGTGAVANVTGVSSVGSAANTIGGTAVSARNVISGNSSAGVSISGFDFQGDRVLGNYIGTNATGAGSVANQIGVVVNDSPLNEIGGTAAGSGNVISGNTKAGVYIAGALAQSNAVAGNRIGTNAAGDARIDNSDGVVVDQAGYTAIGGTETGARNAISGNTNAGVLLMNGAEFSVIAGNYIGTNAAGTGALLNGTNGVSIIGAGSGNEVGGTTGTTPGGACSGACNVISNNAFDGVRIEGGVGQSFVRGNHLGANPAGTSAMGNQSFGVRIVASGGNMIGTGTPAGRNIIAGNSSGGIDLQSSNNTVIGNFIGTKTDGVSPLSNLNNGVRVRDPVTGNVIGGTALPGEANTIAYNVGNGVQVNTGATATRIARNILFSNSGLGIDLSGDGVTANDTGDGDAGANNLQNFPVLASASYASGFLTITGTVNSTADTTLTLEFYTNDSCDSTGNGEGRTFLGEAIVTTNASGNASFSPAFSSPAPTAESLTATASDPSGNTSEFSACIAALNDSDDDNDGFTDVTESGTPLCGANVNNDAFDAGATDTRVNDGCPAVGPMESGPDCEDTVDDDGDGAFNDGCPVFGSFSEGVFKIGTGSLDPCGNTGWPLDLVSTGFSANKVDIVDLGSFVSGVRKLNTNPGETGFNSRWDLVPGSISTLKFINLADMAAMVAGATAYPPMLGGGVKALGGPPCPFPP